VLATPASEEAIYSAVLGPQGRLVIPAEIRKKLGYEPGTVVNIWVEGGNLRMQSQGAAREAAKALFRKTRRSESIVDELIAERRAEAARESDQG